MKLSLLILALAFVAGARADVLIDDFSTGPFTDTFQYSDDNDVETGSMLGGSRYTYMIELANPYNTWATWQIDSPTPGLFYGSGLGLRAATDETWGGYAGFTEDWSTLGATGFSVSWYGADQPLSAEVIVVSNSSTVVSTSTMSIAASSTPFTTTFGLGTFTTPIDLADVDKVGLLLNPGPGADFGIQSFSLVAPVPEPATLAALGLGSAALLRRRRPSR